MIVRFVVTLAVACVLLPSGGLAEASGKRCQPRPHSRTLERTHRAIVIELRPSGRVYGCAFSSNRFVELPTDGRPFTLGGPYVAYNLNYFDATDSYTYLFVQDLRKDGRYRHVGATFTEPGNAYGEASATLTDIVLKRNGSVAWISCFAADTNETRCYPPDPDLRYEVWRMDSGGHKLLEKSADIKLHSLRLKGSTVTWRSAGGTRSATLR